MKNLIIILSVFVISLISCKKSPEEKTVDEKKQIIKPIMSYEYLISDYDKWWSYHYNEIALTSDFKALDKDSQKISKEDFLKKLITGDYIAIEVESENDITTYKLYRLPKDLDNGISKIIKNDSYRAFELFKLEGTKFPDFTVTDVNGIKYNNAKFEGKTTVIKTWFINCKPCIAEMPELNKLVDMYKNKDVQFLSLATDEKKPLLNFLKKNEFKYDVLPNQKDLIQNELKLTAYPTHLVVNEKGIIKKVFNKASQIITYIDQDKLMIKDEKTNLTPPPPPAG